MPVEFSIERRLVRRLTLILAGSFVLFTIVYLFAIQNDAVFHATEEVGELTRDLASTIHKTADGHAAFTEKEVARAANWPPGTAYGAILLPGGEAVIGSQPALLADLRTHPIGQHSGAKVFDMPGGMIVIANERVDVGEMRYRIAVQRPMTRDSIARIGLTHEFAEEILPCFLPTLLLAVFVTWLTIRRNLRPLNRASAEASAVSVDNPGHRMSTRNLFAEIRPLIEAMNRALARLEDALLLQRSFTANAAHELRTPLAVLRARVDGMAQGPMRAALTRDISRMARVVSQMLLTARLQAHAQGETAPVDLALLVRDVAADLAPLAHAQGRDISLDILDRPIIEGSASALESAARNLIENALRFTPKGECVRVIVGAGARFSVEDCGPGVKDADKSRIFEPFWRASGQNSEGSGLGLAIVGEVAAFHGGNVKVEDAEGGGARFVMTLRAGTDRRLSPDGRVSRGSKRPQDAPRVISAE
jgi:signal transduction histidine kinase